MGPKVPEICLIHILFLQLAPEAALVRLANPGSSARICTDLQNFQNLADLSTH